jgi:TolB-like protein/DNA-binding winged helix-turn-helix (wHTH) protein/tetratricopeptide (TPR) repeat protein
VRFGDLEFDLRTGELCRRGMSLKLQPQPSRILVLLVTRAGEIVSRDEIAREVWGGDTFVDFEQGLNYAIRQIRAALNDDADQPRYVETLPKRGYRFIARVDTSEPERAAVPLEAPEEKVVHGSPAASFRNRWYAVAVLALVMMGGVVLLLRGVRPARSHASKIMLVVLPFQNLSGNPEQDYLSEGMTEELITQLGRMRPDRLGVIARTSSMFYQKTDKPVDRIGRELGVQYVVEGSVRRDGRRVRITAQLVQVSDQTHLWAENYDRDASDILGMEEEVATSVSKTIGADLLPAEAHGQPAHTIDPEAYEAYLRGQYFWNKGTAEGYGRALHYFGEAVAKVPTYAEAHAGLADTHNMIGYWMMAPPRQVFPLAKQEAMRALELNPALPQAHAALAYSRFEYDWDVAAAESEFKRALELDANSASAHEWYGILLGISGRTAEMEQQLGMARKLDPLSLQVSMIEAAKDYVLRRYNDAIGELRSMLEMDPNFQPAYPLLGTVYEKTGRHADAVRAWEKGLALAGVPPDAIAELDRKFRKGGIAEFLRGETELLQSMSRSVYISAVMIAMNYTWLNEKDQAFAALEQAYNERSGWLLELSIDPVWDPLRSDPRFASLLQRVKSE